MVDVTGLLALALVAFAGGAFGAAVGGFPALGLSGLLIVVGETVSLSGASLPGTGALGSTGITATLGYGTGFGPHVAFAGGVAAAAFAARRGDVDAEFEYHEAKNVTRALGPRPDVLAVGGVFGVVGLLLAGASAGGFGRFGGSLPWTGLPWDPVAFAVVGSAFLHRVAFGYPLVGSVRNGLLDMSPFERGERRPPRGTEPDDGSGEEGFRTRYVVEPWLPHQYRWASVALLGLVVGVFSAFVTYTTGSVFLPFGVAAFSVLALSLGAERMPVTHHMALPASIVVVGLVGVADPSLVSGGGSVAPADVASAVTLPLAVVAGGLMGVVAGLLGELAQRVLYAHADTHLDPPAVALVVSTLLVAVLDAAGVIVQNVVPTL